MDKEIKQAVKIYLTETGWKKSHGKPVWWPSKIYMGFLKYLNWSSTSMHHNKLILKAILEYKTLIQKTTASTPQFKNNREKLKKNQSNRFKYQ